MSKTQLRPVSLLGPFMSSAPSSPSSSAAVPSSKEEGIVVIPQEYYGVALKMKVGAYRDPSEPPAPAPTPAPAPVPAAAPSRPSHWPMIAAVGGIVVVVGAAFVYLNRDLLFKKPAPPPVAEVPPPPQPPAAPTGLTATSGGQSVSLTWIDTSGEETGYRLERREGEGAYSTLTNLSANSVSFLDVTVQPGRSYAYRVIAMNGGGESASSNEASVAIAALPPPPPPIPTLPPGGLDSDSDGLSDVEEAIMATDSHNPDSDGDGFLDGNEVFHLYNPAARAPGRLIESGLVKAFSASSGWSLYLPQTWEGSLDTPDGVSATIRTGREETFVLGIQPNPDHLTIDQWLLQATSSTGAATSTLRAITTKGGLQGFLSADRMTAAFSWGDHVFVLKYELHGQAFVNLRTFFEMMLNSLRLSGAPVVVSTLSPATSGPGALVGTSTSTDAVPVSLEATSTPALMPAASGTATQTTTTQP